ncbi:MAG TPA: DMT family transporter [Beijerinckiaceae bacterium]|nr:DMT family transporter [Beijerinckiaceae bacterium]
MNASRRPGSRAGAPLLLLGTGGLFGATFPLGKLAAEAGVPPVAWALLIAAGASLVLGAAALVSRRPPPRDAHSLRYYAVAGTISFVAPNVIVFAAIPRLGAGFTAVMFTLSPVLTLALSSLWGLRRPNAFGLAGLALGFVGALLIVFSRGRVDLPADPLWIGLALLVPALLAAGNVYRTVDWPPAADALSLAVGTNGFAALLLLALAILEGGAGALSALARVVPLAAAQIVASAGMFALYFRLQQVGGPVYLSQIGYVGAAVGLVSGTFLLGEAYPAATWLGGLIVACGAVLAAYAMRAGAK